MAATTSSTIVSVPADLFDEVTSIAHQMQQTPEMVVAEALRRYVAVERWRDIQAAVSIRVKELGLAEDDIEDLIDSLDD